MIKAVYEKMSREQLQSLIDESTSIREVLIKLKLRGEGGNNARLKRYLEENNFDTKSLVGRSIYRGREKYCVKPLYEVLKEGTRNTSSAIRERLYNNGIKEKKCEKCGITEWEGEQINFELHHINGVHNDNRLENLIILCPNCHSQTKNYRGRNSNYEEEKEKLKKLQEIASVSYREKYPLLFNKSVTKNIKQCKQKEIRYCQVCGKEITGDGEKYCSCECHNKILRKNKLSKEELLDLSKQVHSLTELRKTINKGLCDNTVKKWCKQYGIYQEVQNNFIQKTYPVLQYDLDGSFIKEWKSADEIEKCLGYRKTKIQNCCRGSQKTSNNYIWRYK